MIKPTPSSIVVTFLLGLVVLAVIAELCASCDRMNKNTQQSEYNKGYYDGYWDAQNEHGVF